MATTRHVATEHKDQGDGTTISMATCPTDGNHVWVRHTETDVVDFGDKCDHFAGLGPAGDMEFIIPEEIEEEVTIMNTIKDTIEDIIEDIIEGTIEGTTPRDAFEQEAARYRDGPVVYFTDAIKWARDYSEDLSRPEKEEALSNVDLIRLIAMTVCGLDAYEDDIDEQNAIVQIGITLAYCLGKQEGIKHALEQEEAQNDA